jgi:hypothetical protein
MTRSCKRSRFRDAKRGKLSPMCGNDPWLGSIELLLSEDQVIEFNAMVGAEAILEFANDADLALIADRMRIWMR